MSLYRDWYRAVRWEAVLAGEEKVRVLVVRRNMLVAAGLDRRGDARRLLLLLLMPPSRQPWRYEGFALHIFGLATGTQAWEYRTEHEAVRAAVSMTESIRAQRQAGG